MTGLRRHHNRAVIRYVLADEQWARILQDVDERFEGVDLQALLADKAFDADWRKQRLLA
ncbi:hypothetical protein P353_15285 [Comamonas testosteroni]|uniref:Uncharacterized protein n=1 Tax=Comamonas testosteroni TaxID=285 RepID=A0A096FE01_COMTE|nr:hypothetical protein P353_15285 [Comamonas testosteroni]